MGTVIEEKWEMTIFYLATLTAIFLLGCFIRFIFM
jgi:hypothetical protein